MNSMTDSDTGYSPASPYHREEKVVELKVCDSCNLTFDSKDVRRSVITGEIYCCKGEDSCWREAAQRHKEGCRLSGMKVTGFE